MSNSIVDELVLRSMKVESLTEIMRDVLRDNANSNEKWQHTIICLAEVMQDEINLLSEAIDAFDEDIKRT